MNEKTLKRLSQYISRFVRFREDEPISAILTYHGVHQEEMKNCVPLNLFKAHLDFLTDHFTLIHLAELVDMLQNGKSAAGRYVVLTFDDAYENFLEYAYPELVKRNIPSTLFVPAGMLGKYNQWDYDHDSSYQRLPIMTADQLHMIDNKLVEIGSHSLSHPRMSGLTDEELEKEIAESKRILELETGKNVKFFAYPYGELADFDDRAIALLEKHNYKAAVTTHFGRKNEKSNHFKLKRISIWDDDTANDLRAKLSGAYDWLASKERVAFFIKKHRL